MPHSINSDRNLIQPRFYKNAVGLVGIRSVHLCLIIRTQAVVAALCDSIVLITGSLLAARTQVYHFVILDNDH